LEEIRRKPAFQEGHAHLAMPSPKSKGPVEHGYKVVLGVELLIAHKVNGYVLWEATELGLAHGRVSPG